MVSKQFISIPSVHILNSEKRAFSQDAQATMQREVQEWMKENPWPRGQGAAGPHGAPGPGIEEWREKWKNFVEKRSQDYFDQTSARYGELDSEYQAKRRRQQVLALNLSRFSPASTMTLGVLSLAKTGIAEHERFLNSVKTYQTIFSQWIRKNMFQDMQFGRHGATPEKPSLDGMPGYGFTPQNLGDSFSQALIDIFIMILMNIVLFAGSYVSFLKYDVR